MTPEDAPKKVYLEWDAEDVGGKFSDAHGVTWCKDKVYETDLEYHLALTWTTERPTVPGWYWWRFTDDVATKQLIIYFHADGIDRKHGEWAGPIEEPR